MPSIYNGKAMASSESLLYFSFWTNLMQMAGGSVQDTKLWLNNLPASRVGHVSAIEAAFGWVFFGYDAGRSGVSGVFTWNNQYQAFHEILRGFDSGRRVVNVFWQPCQDANPSLWVYEYEPVFMVFPRSPRPLADTTIPYQPEFVLETSTIDLLNTNSKFFGTLTMVTKNLSPPCQGEDDEIHARDDTPRGLAKQSGNRMISGIHTDSRGLLASGASVPL